MTDKKLTREELMAIFMSGGRNGGERSRALPSEAYGDPARTIQFEREKKIRRNKKKKGR